MLCKAPKTGLDIGAIQILIIITIIFIIKLV